MENQESKYLGGISSYIAYMDKSLKTKNDSVQSFAKHLN